MPITKEERSKIWDLIEELAVARIQRLEAISTLHKMEHKVRTYLDDITEK